MARPGFARMPFFYVSWLLNLPWTFTNPMTYFLFKSAQPFSNFSETNEQQLIFIKKKEEEEDLFKDYQQEYHNIWNYKISVHNLLWPVMQTQLQVTTAYRGWPICWQWHKNLVYFNLIMNNGEVSWFSPNKDNILQGWVGYVTRNLLALWFI